MPFYKRMEGAAHDLKCVRGKQRFRTDGIQALGKKISYVPMEGNVLFEVRSPLGIHIRVERKRWIIITATKHPVMLGRESEVRDALETPDEVRQNRSDAGVYLFSLLSKLAVQACGSLRKCLRSPGIHPRDEKRPLQRFIKPAQPAKDP